MRFSTFIAGAAGVALFGFLGFRILDLEQRVDALSAQLGAPAEATQGAAPSRTTTLTVAPQGYEKRLAALEQRVKALSAAPKPQAAPDTPGNARLHDDEAILSVVERENQRVRDVQLEWSRSRWLEQREAQLTLFASWLKLEPKQVEALHTSLEHEVNALVEVLKRPNLLDEPDQVAADWAAVLEETDKEAAAVLTPDQRVWWTQGRTAERKTLWPWLPNATARK
jgi:hypothetical protein